MDQGVDAGGGKRIATHQQRLNAESPAQSVVFEVVLGELPHRAIAAKANQVWHLLEHEPQLVKGHVGKLAKANIENLFRVGQQFFVAVDVGRINAFDFFQRIVDAAAVVQVRAVVELVSIPRRYWQDLNVVLDLAIEKLKQLIEEKGRSNHGWSGVEDEAIALESLGATAKLIQALYYGDIEAHLAGTQCAGESAKTAANDDDMFTHTASTRAADCAV